MVLNPYLPWGMSEVSLTIVPMGALLGILLGLGAMLGDLGGSFIKRRFQLKRGALAPLLDQEEIVPFLGVTKNPPVPSKGPRAASRARVLLSTVSGSEPSACTR